MIELSYAPYWRRAVAFLFDLILISTLTLILFIVQSKIIFPVFYPEIAQKIKEIKMVESNTEKSRIWRDLYCKIMPLVMKRRPNLLSRELYDAVKNNDTTSLTKLSSKYKLRINMSIDFSDPLGQVRLSEYNHLENKIYARWDIFYGKYAILFSPYIGFILYFTVLTWLMHGNTPGKYLLRIKVIRIDAQKLSLWDSFSRAGGYSASVATFGLGILEALWHKKRQTIHDRVAETIVVCK